jgi:ferredoxin
MADEYHHEVWTHEETRNAILKEDKFWTADCICRVSKGKTCKRGLHVCLGFEPDFVPADRNVTPAERKEVERLLDFADEKNLVTRPFMDQDNKIVASCFCCSCCCGLIAKEGANLHGKLIQSTDGSLCDSCGICVPVCYFDARTLESEKLKVDNEKCMGCGLCADNCPLDAIEMVSR